jgi:Flp pilus assembly protein TadD
MHTPMSVPTAPPPPPQQAYEGQALYVDGLLALRRGDADHAAALLTQALRRQPEHRGMRRNLVRALLAAKRYDQVLHQANAALAGTPDDAELHAARGTALTALNQHARACAAFSRAVSLRPDDATSWLNMGNAAVDLDDFAAAETMYRTAHRLDSAMPEAPANLGHALIMQARLPEAIQVLATATSQHPDFAPAHWNLAIAALLSGDLPRGFAEYEWRKRHVRYRADFPPLPGPIWDGTSSAGQTILVRAEQGFGDVIHFARYLPLIRARGAHPILLCAPDLVLLIQSMDGVEAIATPPPLPPYDAWIDQISLPRIFATTLHTIPTPIRYLSADPIRTQAWRTRLSVPPDNGTRKIGVAFTGNPNHHGDRRRSIPPDLAAPLLRQPRLRFINLQHGPAAATLDLPDLTQALTDYAETAALIANLDLVITVDTSVAHLAGALGKPVWILLPHAPDWRWMLDRRDSPWYAAARLFRQPTPGDWASVLAQVTRELSENPPQSEQVI